MGEGGLRGLNREDMKCMEVLKEGWCRGIYGCGGGNGVVLVSSKRGVGGEREMRLDGSLGV